MGKKNKGFTLVELVVVIVITGILAAAAVPAYNGYVKKANEANDVQLLAAMNQAYAAACLEMGRDPKGLTAAASLEAVDGGKGLKLVGLSAKIARDGDPDNGAALDGLNDAFLRYFGNAEAVFKTFALLRYVQPAGAFEGYAAGDKIRVNSAYGLIEVDAADVLNFQKSTYSELGLEDLMKEVDNVTVGAAQVFTKESTRNSLLNDKGFTAYLKTLGYTDDQISALNSESKAKELANAVVLYTASKTKDMSASDIIATFQKTGNWPEISASLTDSAVAQTIPYAMMLAYANSEFANDYKIGGKTGTGFMYHGKFYDDSELIWDDYPDWDPDNDPYEIVEVQIGGQSVKEYFSANNDISSLQDVLDLETAIIQTPGFTAYMQTDQAQSDLEGFLSSMTMMNSNVKSKDTADAILENGYTNSAWTAALSAVLGS